MTEAHPMDGIPGIITSAVEEGKDAFTANKPMNSCPYVLGSVERKCWMMGWAQSHAATMPPYKAPA